MMCGELRKGDKNVEGQLKLYSVKSMNLRTNNINKRQKENVGRIVTYAELREKSLYMSR